MPKRTRSHQLEALSRNRLHQIFEGIGWTVEDIAEDYGEDLLVRIFEEGSATPLMFFVQAKATDDSTRYVRKKDDRLFYPVKTDHVSHWRRFREPVILTLWDSQLDCTYWTCVQDSFDRPRGAVAKGRKTIPIGISRESKLDPEGLRRIRSLVIIQYKRVMREERATSILLEHLAKEFNIKVENSPESGILSVEAPSGEVELIFTGKAAVLLNEATAKHKKSPKQVLLSGMRALLKELDDHKRTGMFPVTDRKTGEVKKRRMTMSEVRDHLNIELKFYDDQLEGKLNLDDELI